MTNTNHHFAMVFPHVRDGQKLLTTIFTSAGCNRQSTNSVHLKLSACLVIPVRIFSIKVASHLSVPLNNKTYSLYISGEQ